MRSSAAICLRAPARLEGSDLVFHGTQRLAWPAMAAQQARITAMRAAHGSADASADTQLTRRPTAGMALLHRSKQRCSTHTARCPLPPASASAGSCGGIR